MANAMDRAQVTKRGARLNATVCGLLTAGGALGGYRRELRSPASRYRHRLGRPDTTRNRALLRAKPQRAGPWGTAARKGGLLNAWRSARFPCSAFWRELSRAQPAAATAGPGPRFGYLGLGRFSPLRTGAATDCERDSARARSEARRQRCATALRGVLKGGDPLAGGCLQLRFDCPALRPPPQASGSGGARVSPPPAGHL